MDMRFSFEGDSVRPDLDPHPHRLLATARAYAAYRQAGRIVGADGQSNMALVHQAAMGDVHAEPEALRHVDADVGPGVAREHRRLGRVEIAADVARRNAQRAARPDEHMRL